MGNREDLLAGAEECLYEKGFARTTARDIATRSGVSLAGIGYHFGSKEELLKQALRQALEKWGDAVGAILTREVSAGDMAADPAGRFTAVWSQVLESFRDSARLWAIQFELLGVLEREPELRAAYAADTRQARIALATLFGTATTDEEQSVRVGALYQAMLAGLAAQYLGDPDSVPTAADLLEAVRLVASALQPASRTE
jgi:AcrR family transcriptional regulator